MYRPIRSPSNTPASCGLLFFSSSDRLQASTEIDAAPVFEQLRFEQLRSRPIVHIF